MSAPVILCILDGWGAHDVTAANAPALAETPNFDRLIAEHPNAHLITHGPDAGLPSGQMGNSEVGHTNIGAGRVVAMDLGQIDLAIEDGSFGQSPEILDFAARIKATGGAAHLIGLTSHGGVHAHQDHIVAAAQALVGQDVPVVVHIITDGRDVAPTSAQAQIAEFTRALPPEVRIATISGRYFAMDRDNRWDRVARAYGAIIKAQGESAPDLRTALEAGYARGETDEFITPTVLDGHQPIRDGDGVFFLNFRADRAREILAAIGDPSFTGFDTGPRPRLAGLLGMVNYSTDHDDYMTTVFPKQEIKNTLGAWVAQHGLRQFRLAETEKYPHVTFFLNGGIEAQFDGEDRHMAPSPKVATYDLQPEMSAGEVGDKLAWAISQRYDLIVVNFANPDMVGHTGDLDAAIAACAAVDAGLGKAMAALEDVGEGAMIVTADHGNCEMMVDPETGGPHTAHTLNPVPVIVVGAPGVTALRDGRLADLAPTVLDLMGLTAPPEMTGESLLVR